MSSGCCKSNKNRKVFFDVKADNENLGIIIFELFDNIVPKTTENFYKLCMTECPSGFKGSKFHRVIQGFMAQGGDFTRGDGTGGKSIYGKDFNDENFDVSHYCAGLLSMANRGPNTNGSQFFITFEKTPWLDGKHVVFGKVTDGMDVVKKIENLGSESGRTKKKILIEDCGEVVEEGCCKN